MSAIEQVSRAVRQTLDEWSASRAGGGRVYVGYSGGVDSSVLLHAASVLAPDAVVAVHVNHGLQDVAEEWSAHCERECARLGVPLRCRRASVQRAGNQEAAARAARYAFFADLVGPGDLLLLAHHRDDQVETLLLRLLQGRGFYGMPQGRALGRTGELRRPLLGLPRAVLQAYALDVGLRWVEDPSNVELDKDRNWLRHRLLPELRGRWPDVDRSLLEMLRTRDAEDAAWLGLLAPEHGRLPLANLPKDRRAAAHGLRIWLKFLGVRLPTRSALGDFVEQLAAPADRQPELILDQGTLRRFREHVYWVVDPPALAARYSLSLPGVLTLPHGELTVVRDAQGFAPAGDIHVAFVGGHPGGWILQGGHRRRLRELLQGAGVPPWERDIYPILLDDEGVAALPGIAQRDAPSKPRGRPGYRSHWRARDAAR